MIRSILSLETSCVAMSTPSHASSTSPTWWPKSAVSTTICRVSFEPFCAVQACLVVVNCANGDRHKVFRVLRPRGEEYVDLGSLKGVEGKYFVSAPSILSAPAISWNDELMKSPPVLTFISQSLSRRRSQMPWSRSAVLMSKYVSVKVVVGRLVKFLNGGHPAFLVMSATAEGQNFRSTSRNMFVFSLQQPLASQGIGQRHSRAIDSWYCNNFVQ